MLSASASTDDRPAAELLREAARLEAVDRLAILDTSPDPAFDVITRLIRATLGVGIAIVSVIDAHRQWYISRDGLAAPEAPRKDTFCRHVIELRSTLIVADARLDPRFADNPRVAGEPYVRFYAGVPLVTRDGHVVGTVCAIDTEPRAFGPAELALLEDFATLAMSQIELRQIASSDALTGVMTRRSFMEQATRAVVVARRQGHEVSCIVLDIDHFKTVNDRYGHPAGDRVLAACAQACADVFRETDLFGRLGGEEFAALVYAGRRSAAEVAERLRAAIEQQRFDADGISFRITASLGIAALDTSTADLHALLARADAALYEAKNAGRNRCMAATPGPAAIAASRRRVFKAGKILFFNRNSTVDCTVRTLGPEGAGVEVSATAGIPELFTLAIRADGIERRCKIVGRTDRSLDLEFV